MTTFLLLLALSGPADQATGLQLLRMCNGEPGSMAHAGCLLYMQGFQDALRASVDVQRQAGRPLACLPSLLTAEEMRVAYRARVKDNANRLSAPMNAALVGVVVEAYPCR